MALAPRAPVQRQSVLILNPSLARGAKAAPTLPSHVLEKCNPGYRDLTPEADIHVSPAFSPAPVVVPVIMPELTFFPKAQG